MKLIIRTSKTHNHVFLPRKIELLDNLSSSYLGIRHVDENSDYYKTLLPSEIEELKATFHVRKKSVLAIIDEKHFDKACEFNERMNNIWKKYLADEKALQEEFKSFLKEVDER